MAAPSGAVTLPEIVPTWASWALMLATVAPEATVTGVAEEEVRVSL